MSGMCVRGRGTTASIFTRTQPGNGGQHASARRDEYSQREFYRTYHHYMAGHLDLAARPPC
jgi:hypothetical protein